MFLVALTQLRQPVDQVVRALTSDLLETEYEVRARLRGVPPNLVSCTDDRDAALRTLAVLRSGTNKAVACDSTAVRSSVQMVSLRTFELKSDGVVGHSPAGDPMLLPWEDVLAAVRAQVDDNHLLYVFRASGEIPWILRERGTNYAALGARQTDDPRTNFLEAVQHLRVRAPGAAFDERLLASDIDAPMNLLRSGSALGPEPDPALGSVAGRRSSHAVGTRGTPYPRRIPEARVPVFAEGVRRTTPPPARYSGPQLGTPWRRSEFPRSAAPPLALGPTLIPGDEDEPTARRVTTDVLAHITALAHARKHL